MTALDYSENAKRDLRGIWDYTFAIWSKTQADKYYNSLIGSCERVARNPALGRKYTRGPVRFLGYPEGRHIIFYRIVSPEKILIVRTLHVSMGFKNRP